MKYGMPNLVECASLEECAELARELSLDFIEINMSFPEYCSSMINIGNLNKIAKEYGVFYTIHADEALNPFDFNPIVSECYFQVMRDTLRIARKIDAKVINMHLQKGIYVTLTDRVILLTDIYRERYLECVKRFIKLAEEEIGGTNIRICIENVDSNEFTEAQIAALGLFMQSDCFALTLDTGHAHKLKYCDSHIFDKYEDKVMHMHLHDCVGAAPHAALGYGDVDIMNSLGKLRGDTCLIEVKTVNGLRDSVEYLKKQEIYYD